MCCGLPVVLFFRYFLLLCIGAILKTKSTPEMSKLVCIRGRVKHDKCYLCKTKVY